uniref:Urokinase plasminogen activator surface receptor-like n=1 Tax=Cyprinodon variegatus TaxID=28743 RepID=A0A3Q2DG86_CYPVA
LADTLDCYECTPDPYGTCKEGQTTCEPVFKQCAALKQVTFAESISPIEVKARGCGTPADCVEGSVNYGVSRAVVKSTCCSTNLCNSYPVISSNPPPNGRKCYTCVGENCGKTLQCLENENYCIKSVASSSGQTATLKGCASESVCLDLKTSLIKRLTNDTVTKNTGIKHYCCKGDFCNSASSASPALLLFLMPVFFMSYFS